MPPLLEGYFHVDVYQLFMVGTIRQPVLRTLKKRPLIRFFPRQVRA